MTGALSRNTDPSTSHEAAASIVGALPRIERAVLAALVVAPNGATNEELARSLGLSLVTVSPRMKPLVTKGLVYAAAHKRAGSSGRKQTVWCARREPRQERLL